MGNIGEFRAVMKAAVQVAKCEGVPVSPGHVIYAYVVSGEDRSPVSLTVVSYGNERGWDRAFGRPKLLGSLRHFGAPKYDPGLRNKIERAARGGVPDIRSILLALLRRGELAGLTIMVARSGSRLDEWLAADD